MVKGKLGQIQTVEAITAAIILVSVVALIVESTSVTPLTSSFTNQHIKLELQNMGTDLLTALDETPWVDNPPGTPYDSSYLKVSITDWINGSYGGTIWYAWSNNTTKYVSLLNYNPTTFTLNTPLSNALSIFLTKYGIAFNVEVRYTNLDGKLMNTKMIWNGDPSDNSVTVSRIIVLHDCDIGVYNPVIPDISLGSQLYNTVEVRLTMWVM
jgi:hypothetical protein